MSRHGSARVLRRPRWSSAVAVAAITALVGLGACLTVWHPIATAPALSSSRALSSETTTDVPPTTPGSATPPFTVTASASAAAELATSTGTRVPAVASGQPCRPVRFTLASLAIDASVVTLSLTAEGDLGTPNDADRRSAGWFPSVLAGSARGTVLMDGHTYHDGSAVFPTTFKRQVQPGMLMRLSCADGHAFSYRITEVVLDLTPTGYPGFVRDRNLYAADGPAQLVMVTCTDYLPAQRVWANRAVVVAVPVA